MQTALPHTPVHVSFSKAAPAELSMAFGKKFRSPQGCEAVSEKFFALSQPWKPVSEKFESPSRVWETTTEKFLTSSQAWETLSEKFLACLQTCKGMSKKFFAPFQPWEPLPYFSGSPSQAKNHVFLIKNHKI